MSWTGGGLFIGNGVAYYASSDASLSGPFDIPDRRFAAFAVLPFSEKQVRIILGDDAGRLYLIEVALQCTRKQYSVIQLQTHD